MPTRGYQSSVDYTLVFGLGETDSISNLTVVWPDFKEQSISNVEANQTLLLHQKDARRLDLEAPIHKETYFTDVSTDSLISFIHRENNFNDFKSEQLLLHKLSTQGPKIAKGDVNNDGLEDIYLGGAHGYSGQLLLQTKGGKFKASNTIIFEKDKDFEDVDALFFDADNDKDLDLFVVSGGNEFLIDSQKLQDRLYVNTGNGNYKKSEASLPLMISSGSCVTVGDYDSDGDLDLFVGGRLVPGKYPTTPKSYILQNDGKGNFKDVTAAINKSIENIGMVTDAIWTDFTNDGVDDLIVVGEFMGIQAFENSNGELTELPDSSGLKNTNGWWNTIEQGDFDNDGDLDYIVGNFGLNSQLKSSEEEPVQLYVKDFDNNGSLDPILCSYVMGESYPVFSKDDLIGQLPHLKRKYVNYSDYADQKISDIFTSEELADATVLKAVTFSSSYLENLGNGNFDIKALPSAAQFSPIYGIVAKDFNQDGNLDIITGGNFFGTRVKYGRYDANKGTLLFGNGKGSFETVSNLESGFNIDGEVRDIVTLKLANEDEIIMFAKNNSSSQTYIMNK